MVMHDSFCKFIALWFISIFSMSMYCVKYILLLIVYAFLFGMNRSLRISNLIFFGFNETFDNFNFCPLFLLYVKLGF